MAYNYNYKYQTKECAYCGDYSGKYELCSECYNLSKEEYIIKNEKGEWIKNIRKGNEYKFYDETKEYYLKEHSLNEFEMEYFYAVENSLSKKYLIIPQVNLQSIVETNTNKRNDELFRNIDFVIYKTDGFIPILAIELNGKQHYTNDYWKERDKSVKAILNKVQLPLLTIDIEKLKKMDNIQKSKITKKVISYINPNFFQRLFNKKRNKMDLSWTEELCRTNYKY